MRREVYPIQENTNLRDVSFYLYSRLSVTTWSCVSRARAIKGSLVQRM